MLPRFYAPDLRMDGPFELPPDEAHHLLRVLRLREGDWAAVFDGRGFECRAEVVSTRSDRVTLRAGDPIDTPQRPSVNVTLAQALLKGSSMDGVVRDATMLGVHTIQPLLTEHCTVKASVAVRPGSLDRWRRIALASVKQSRRATLPSINAPAPFDEWLRRGPVSMTLIFVEPSVGIEPRPLRLLLEEPVPSAAAVLIGPEGGWSGHEVAAAIAAGAIPVSLGPLTIRAESMPVAALSALTVLWDRWTAPGTAVTNVTPQD